MEHTDREISNGHRRRNGTTERHYETTGVIGHRRKLAEETRMNRVDNTKGFKHGLHIIVGHFKRQITNKHETNGLVGSGNRNRDITKEERRSIKEIVPVVWSLAGDSCTTTCKEFVLRQSFQHQGLAASKWCNFRNSLSPVISAGKCSTTLLANVILCKYKLNVSVTTLSGPHQCSADVWDKDKPLKPPRVSHASGNISVMPECSNQRTIDKCKGMNMKEISNCSGFNMMFRPSAFFRRGTLLIYR